jgi:hypothetical protein
LRSRSGAVRPNVRTVSPSASYLIRPQVTKGPGSWFGGSFVAVPSLRRRSVGPRRTDIHVLTALSPHPCRSAHSTPPAFSLHPSRDLCRLGNRALRSKIKSERSSGVSPEPCGRRRRSRRQRSGGSVKKLSTDLPPSSERGPGCQSSQSSQSSSVSHRALCTAGNLDTPPNSGAADRALANARAVSPSASYLKRHQVTKCPGSRLGPRSSGSLTPATLRGPAPNGHPCPDGALAASMPLGPLRTACAQPAPKSRFVSSGLTRA